VAGLAATSTLAAVHSRLRGPERLVHLELFFSGVAFATMLATLYEVTEYTEDFITGSHRLGDGFDTVNDLVLGMVGGLLPLRSSFGFPICALPVSLTAWRTLHNVAQ
jgi:hypothetical protein